MSSATREELSNLHALVAQELLKLIRDPDPEIKLKGLNQAIKFLKDNHIEASAGQGTPLQDLMDEVAELPFG